LDQSADVFALFDEAEGGAEADFADNVVGHIAGYRVSGSVRLYATLFPRVCGKYRITYTAHQAKSKGSPVLTKFSSSLLLHSRMRASINGSIFLMLVKLYYTRVLV
jgi:hypothetical protein